MGNNFKNKGRWWNERSWKLGKQTARDCDSSFARKIEKIKKEKIIISADFITDSLKCASNFLGCFSEDQLKNVSITSFPCFLIVNIDSSNMTGSHWIGIGIFKESIEIFDPLGFNIFNWPRIPHGLHEFLHGFSVSRRVKIIPRIQSDSSFLCGLYSIYYVIRRKTASFETCFKCFNFKNFIVNDGIVCNFFE